MRESILSKLSPKQMASSSNSSVPERRTERRGPRESTYIGASIDDSVHNLQKWLEIMQAHPEEFTIHFSQRGTDGRITVVPCSMSRKLQRGIVNGSCQAISDEIARLTAPRSVPDNKEPKRNWRNIFRSRGDPAAEEKSSDAKEKKPVRVKPGQVVPFLGVPEVQQAFGPP